MPSTLPTWLAWAREIFSLSQAGLAYSKNEFDLQRYRRLQEISAEIVASQSELEKAEILGDFTKQTGYATPKIDVRGAVIRDGKILLVQERADNCWSMPGGWADLGDSPAEMVVREVWEESGLRVRAAKVVAVYDATRIQPYEFWHAYKIVFLCELLGGELTPSYETLAVDFFDPEDLPPLSKYRTNEAMIREVYAHVAEPGRPAAFD